MGRRQNPIFVQLVEQAVIQVKDISDPSEREFQLDNAVASLAAELSDTDLNELAAAQPHLFRDRIPEYFPDGPEEGIDLIERNVRELAVEAAQRVLQAEGHSISVLEIDETDTLDEQALADTSVGGNAGIFRLDTDADGQPRFRSHIAEAKRLLSELVWHPEADDPFTRQSLGLAAASFSGEFAARYILQELYQQLVKKGARDGWLYDELRDLLGITKTPDEVARERRFAEAVIYAPGRSPLDVQHPFNEITGKWMAHCVQCGEYVDDMDHEPAADFLCERCEEADE